MRVLMAESPTGCAQIRSVGFQWYPASFSLSMTAWLGLSSGPAFAKLDRHLAVTLALEEADAGEIVAGDAERIGAGNPFPLSYPSAKLGRSGLVSGAGGSAIAVVVSVDGSSGVRSRDDMW